MSLNKLTTELGLLEEPVLAASEVRPAIVVELTAVDVASSKYAAPIMSESADLEAKYTTIVSPMAEPRNMTSVVPIFPKKSNSNTLSAEKLKVALSLEHVEGTTRTTDTAGVASTEDTTTYEPDSESRRVDDAARRQRVAAIEEKRKRVIRLSWTVNTIARMLLGIGFMFVLLFVMLVMMAIGVHTSGPTEFMWVIGTLSVTTLVRDIFQLLVICLSFEIKSD